MTKRKLASAICKLEGGKHNTKIEDVMQVLTRLEEIAGEEKFLANESKSIDDTDARAEVIAERIDRAYAKSPFAEDDDRKAFLADYRAKQAAKGKKAVVKAAKAFLAKGKASKKAGK